MERVRLGPRISNQTIAAWGNVLAAGPFAFVVIPRLNVEARQVAEVQYGPSVADGVVVKILAIPVKGSGECGRGGWQTDTADGEGERGHDGAFDGVGHVFLQGWVGCVSGP